jgi:hypothetical protein
MEIPEVEVQDILGYSSVIGTNKGSQDMPTNNKKKRRNGGQSNSNQPSTSTATPTTTTLPDANLDLSNPSPLEASLVSELVETKQKLEKVTGEMEDMRKEMATIRSSNTKPATRIFALGFVPSIALAKPNVELLRWVAEVLSISMKRRMEVHRDHFRIIEQVSGVDAIGARTCPSYNKIERCSLKWHQMVKTTRSGYQRTELRIHCCTLCLEALGIICGHPLLKCPWIYEDTWTNIPFSKVE